MLVEKVVTYMEMTSPDQLIPGRPPPAPIQMDRVGPPSAPLLASTYTRVGNSYHWTPPSEAEWEEGLGRPGAHAWVARVEGEVAGMVALKAEEDGNVEIMVTGLVPDFVAKGFGGHLVELATRLAWNLSSPDGTRATRVWLHTSSFDHPHARPNYERRGFRVFRTEKKQQEIPP